MAILIAFVAGRMTRFFLRRAADHLDERYPPVLAVALRAIERSIGPALFVAGLRVGLFFLILPEAVAGLAQTLVSILFVLATAYVIYCLVDVVNFWLTAFSKKTESKLDDMLAPVVRKSLRVTIVILALIQMATILSDKPITSVLAGLGVGGLAVWPWLWLPRIPSKTSLALSCSSWTNPLKWATASWWGIPMAPLRR